MENEAAWRLGVFFGISHIGRAMGNRIAETTMDTVSRRKVEQSHHVVCYQYHLGSHNHSSDDRRLCNGS